MVFQSAGGQVMNIKPLPPPLPALGPDQETSLSQPHHPISPQVWSSLPSQVYQTCFSIPTAQSWSRYCHLFLGCLTSLLTGFPAPSLVLVTPPVLVLSLCCSNSFSDFPSGEWHKTALRINSKLLGMASQAFGGQP